MGGAAETVAPASLAGAGWLESPQVRAVFEALGSDGDETRIVGGAVRNALMGLPVVEVDFATTAAPDEVAERAGKAGIKVVPTGIDHGTLTLVVGGRGFEVTTLREDIETDGRRAVVRFGRDWAADAWRRDFTVNALSVEANGKVHDPIGGYPDILAHRIRFIGDPDQRVAEDRLRILRLFRLHAQYGAGELDREGLAAAIRGRNALRELSAERISQEMRRLVVAAGAVDSVTVMQDTGILPIVLGGVGYLGPFARLAAIEKVLGTTPQPALRLAALGARIEEDAARLAARLRLANSERDRISAAVAAARGIALHSGAVKARAMLYRLGADRWRDSVMIAFAWSKLPTDDAETAALFSLPDRWPIPVFPLGGDDAIRQGIGRGPAVGAALKAVEAWWVENDFEPDESALRARLQQMTAGAQ